MPIVKRKNKRGIVYQVRVQDSLGRWLPSRTFDRKEDAARYEFKLREEAKQGTLAVIARRKQIPFAQFWEEWADCRGSNISAGWRISQDQMGRDYILPVIGHVPLENLTARHVAEILKSMERFGRSEATKRLVYNLLHSVLQRAVESNLIQMIPEIKRLRPRVSKAERVFLKPTEIWRLLEAAKEDFLGPAIWLSALAGLRCEAVQALRWKRVDFENRQILICETYKRKTRTFGKPKGKDAEFVPMARPLVEYLRMKRGLELPDSFVCPGKNGGMLDHHVFLDGLTRLCAKAGVTRVTPHGLRHSCTELFVVHGASLEDLRRLLNHEDSSTTELYVHRTPERLQALAQSIEAPFPIQSKKERPKLSVVR